MRRFLPEMRTWGLGLLALIMLVVGPSLAEAAGIGFRNDSMYPVYVQGSVVVNGKIRRGQLLYLRPGQTAWDVNLLIGPRTITVYSPNNLKLYEDIHLFNGNDQFFSINQSIVPNGQPPRVELKPLPLPKGN